MNSIFTPEVIEEEIPKTIEEEFVADVISSFQPLTSEISVRNAKIRRNDSFIYGEELTNSLDIPIGHDKTPINWLRRTVEIHRSQFMGKGFSFDSSFKVQDITTDDEKEKQRLVIENNKKKSYAEMRRELCMAINRDNDGDSFWSSAAENASAVGDTVIKGWYDKENKKYILQQIESIENFYVLWSQDEYRNFDAVAYISQISLPEAMRLYYVPETIQTSPIGAPLTPISTSNYEEYKGTQEMVTIIEVTGKVPGWMTVNENLKRTIKGKETELNAIIVGNQVFQIIDDVKKLPKHYILPNKRARKRPWGISDITETAIQINITYIEAFSDWRTVSNKVNFPKFKAFGFPLGVQPPRPKARTVEFLPLAEGQDIVQLSMDKNEADFKTQLEECENQFVREVGVSRQLFDMPDTSGNSNPALLTSMKSVSDITNTKRELWEPIIREIFEDALYTISEYNTDVKSVVVDDEDWHIKISFPSSMNADDPSYNSSQLNMFNTGVISLQTLLENLGYDKQEVDRIRSEMEDPLTAAIHGHMLDELAQMKINPPGPVKPKVSINLRGDLSPEQEANLAYQKGINDGPFGQSMTAQGNAGMTAQANADNEGLITGGEATGGKAISKDAQGNTMPLMGQQTPQLMNGANSNQPGVGIMSQPGSGATATTPEGKLAQVDQRAGK